MFLGQGYAVAGVNVRGTGCSGGSFDYFERAEWLDGRDAIEFLATQPWSNGDLAMVGKSYPGITQLYVAAEKPSHLRAIVPGAYFGDLYRDIPYPGGILNSVFAAGWSFGSQPVNSFDQWSEGVQSVDQTCIRSQVDHAANPVTNPFVRAAEHQWDDELYRERSGNYVADQIDVPVLAEIAWQDEEVGSRGLDWLTHLQPSVPWRAVVMNGDHGEYYGDYVKPEIFRFLSYYLKKSVPAGDACSAPTFDEALACYKNEPKLLVNFENSTNRVPSWQQRFTSWPVTENVLRMHLHDDGTLDTTTHRSGETPTPYVYQFPAGSNSYGNTSELPGDLPFVDYWQQQPPRQTVAKFTTPPFAKDTLFVGTASADLWISSTAPDTDLEVMITEIRPDGSEQYVQKGWLRASHRILDDTLTTPLRPYQTHQLGDFAPLLPGQPTKARVEIFPFGQVFRAGTRLRLTIEAPTTLPELWGFAANPVPAVNQIYTDTAHPSSLALPLVAQSSQTFPPERACGTLRNQPCRPSLP
ncbi:MAG: CocE/NonD family hydrolase [Actinobacteria bacterium]|nr:CocE/NonD family hydrolase [Actinomycetota bacterium]